MKEINGFDKRLYSKLRTAVPIFNLYKKKTKSQQNTYNIHTYIIHMRYSPQSKIYMFSF